MSGELCIIQLQHGAASESVLRIKFTLYTYDVAKNFLAYGRLLYSESFLCTQIFLKRMKLAKGQNYKIQILRMQCMNIFEIVHTYTTEINEIF